MSPGLLVDRGPGMPTEAWHFLLEWVQKALSRRAQKADEERLEALKKLVKAARG